MGWWETYELQRLRSTVRRLSDPLGSSLRKRDLADWWTTGDGELIRIQVRIIEVQDKGYCILREHFASPLINSCRDAFWPLLLAYLKNHGNEPNRGLHRHFPPDALRATMLHPRIFL